MVDLLGRRAEVTKVPKLFKASGGRKVMDGCVSVE